MEISFPPAPDEIICIVDSDPAVRDSLSSLASLYGRKARSFSTGRSFLESFANFTVSHVICEARLPDVSGLEVHRRLREQGGRSPFVLLVSRDVAQVRRDAQMRGVSLVVSKPIVNPMALLAFLEIESSRQADAVNGA